MMLLKKVLLLGCGRIGVGADLETSDVVTYAKALSKRTDVHVYLYDTEKEKIEIAHEKYGFSKVENISDLDFSDFYLCIIAVPSNQHFSILVSLLQKNVPRVICEKPICLEKYEIQKIKEVSEISTSQVFVSYNRNFSNIIRSTREVVRDAFQDQTPLHISISYQKGALNNCSHAISFCEYIIDRHFLLNDFNVRQKAFDQFDNDPTVSGDGKWNSVSVNLEGLINMPYPFLEILISYPGGYITVSDCASSVKIYKVDESNARSRFEKCRLIHEAFIESNTIENIVEYALAGDLSEKRYVDLSSVLNMTDELLTAVHKDT